MARINISPESQQQRLHHLRNEVSEILRRSPQLLLTSPAPGKWSAAEVLDHMIQGHAAYREKLDGALSQLRQTDPWEHLRARRLPNMLFKGFTPKEGRIRYKMKTMKVFEPKMLLAAQEGNGLPELARAFFASLDHLEELARKSKTLDVARVKFPSAIGPLVRFNVSEAVEFILRHNERHLLQIRQTLAAIGSKEATVEAAQAS